MQDPTTSHPSNAAVQQRLSVSFAPTSTNADNTLPESVRLATSAATPLNLPARRRRRRSTSRSRVPQDVFSDGSDDEEEPRRERIQTSCETSHNSTIVPPQSSSFVQQPPTPTNMASRRRRRAERELSASRLPSNRVEAAVELPSSTSGLMRDTDGLDSESLADATIPGSTLDASSHATVNRSAREGRRRTRERRSRAAQALGHDG